MKTESSVPRQPLWFGSDKEWSTALIHSRAEVSRLLYSLSSEDKAIEFSHRSICAAAETYIRSLHGVRREASGARRRLPLKQPLAAIPALERLMRSSDPRLLVKAWNEMPMVALDAICDACMKFYKKRLGAVMVSWPTVPGEFVQIDVEKLHELARLAVIEARAYGNRNPLRDRTLLAAIREYRNLVGSWPDNELAFHFVDNLSTCFRELNCPKGFGISAERSIYRFLQQAISDGKAHHIELR